MCVRSGLTRTEVSYRHRERAVLEVKVSQSYQKVCAQRVAVISTDWLDVIVNRLGAFMLEFL
jgi:hypothetical protein